AASSGAAWIIRRLRNCNAKSTSRGPKGSRAKLRCAIGSGPASWQIKGKIFAGDRRIAAIGAFLRQRAVDLRLELLLALAHHDRETFTGRESGIVDPPRGSAATALRRALQPVAQAHLVADQQIDPRRGEIEIGLDLGRIGLDLRVREAFFGE